MTNGNLLIQILKGGSGSGDWGHTGRAGKRGGSGGGGGKGKSRRGRRSREVLDKEIEVGKKPKVDVAAFDKRIENARKINTFNKVGVAWDDNEIHSEYEEWSGIVSNVERELITTYTSTGLHMELNEHLRGIRSSEFMGDFIEGLDNVLESAPRLSKDTILYRATDGNILKNLKPGDEFIDKGFGSTSISENFVDGFDPGDMKLTILAPKGSKGAYIADMSPIWHEQGEFLLPRNAKFKVVKSTVGDPNEVRNWNIWLEYVGTE